MPGGVSSTGFALSEGDASVALLFSDMEDSTAMFDRLGAERVAEAWTAHDRRARDLLQRHGGCEVGRSDGMFLLFPSIDAGARYALDYHEALRDLALRARVGLHWGRVTLRENAADDVARGAPRWEVNGVAT